MNPAIGYRVWRIDEWLSGPRLASPNRYTPWVPGVPLMAECLDESSPQGITKAHRQQPEVAPPLEGCSCGIYAYHDVQRMRGALNSELVGGAVLCWGRITIHPEGIRAQFARPLVLCFPEISMFESTPGSLIRLGASYGLPLLEASHIEVFAREFGESYEPAPDPSTAWSARVRKSVREFFRW